jgi:hypothetical protein
MAEGNDVASEPALGLDPRDDSQHGWIAGLPALDLIVTMDDATSEIYSAFLLEEEGTASSLRILAEVFGAHGLPSSLHADRGSHYFARRRPAPRSTRIV